MNINRKKIREQIPRGGCAEIAKMAGVTVVSVSNYFSNNINSERIESAALRYLANLNLSKKELLKAIYE